MQDSSERSHFSPQELWDAWAEERFVQTPAPCLTYDALVSALFDLRDRHADAVTLEPVGQSFQGRDIYLMTVGTGARKVLLWSQMHGDEPSATPALLDMVHFLLSHRDDPRAARVLGELTLLIVPRLNPDGSEAYQRRNAQGIDVNRDALNLATPEGALLKRLRDEHLPMLGFNLHDQDRDHTVGDTGVLATNAVLAVTGDAENTLTPGRLRTKRACTAIAEALAHFMPGGMSRYDETWSPRSFGDNITAWGTPVVLLESGGLPPGHPFEDLSRLNFVALLRVLDDLARDDLAGHDPSVYDQLPDNENDEWVDVIVRDGRLLQPGTDTPYRADLAILSGRSDKELAGCAEEPLPRRSRITEVGDARFLHSGRDVDADGALVTLPWTVGLRGLAAREHLHRDGLLRLARLGVGIVRWRVAADDVGAAREHAESVDGAGLPAVRVEADAAPAAGDEAPEQPSLTVSAQALSLAGSAKGSLADVLASLGGAELLGGPGDESAEALLGRLGADGGSERGLLPGHPGSFLVWSPLVDGRVVPDVTALRAVWLDGREVVGPDVAGPDVAGPDIIAP